MITPCAAHRPFKVSSDSDGGQSIRMKSYCCLDRVQFALQARLTLLELDQLDFRTASSRLAPSTS